MVYTDPREVPQPAAVALVGVIVLLVASILPWYDAMGESVNGLDAEDGYLTVAVGVAVLGTVIGLEWSPLSRAVATVGGLLSAYISYNTYSQTVDLASHDYRIGIVLIALGALLLLGAVVLDVAESVRSTADADGLGNEGGDT